MYAKEKRELLKHEIVQRREEGCDTSGIEERLADAGDSELDALYLEIMALKPGPEFPYTEPSSLAEIGVERPDGPRRMSDAPSGDALADRILGGWQGRCAGCLLGKPVEGWHPDKIRDTLAATGGWELDGYFAPEAIRRGNPNAHPGSIACTLGSIKAMERDDDTDYTIIGLHVMETHGPAFLPEHILECWGLKLPYLETYTAERAAYRNFVNGMEPPATAGLWNPYREWIGAQIRADAFGYVAPGWPERAAELAFRDACVSHTKNGIYGEMWVAAMIAAAFVTDDLDEIIRVGLSEIPERCRLAETIRSVLEWHQQSDDWQRCHTKIMETTGHYHVVHTINNAAIVAMGLLYGGGDFERSICIAVMGGLDTDCNGATVGSIVGVLRGAKALPQKKWIAPMNDTIRSSVAGHDRASIAELARRTAVQAEKVSVSG